MRTYEYDSINKPYVCVILIRRQEKWVRQRVQLDLKKALTVATFDAVSFSIPAAQTVARRASREIHTLCHWLFVGY